MTPQVISLSSLGSTAWIPVDYKQNPFNIGLACVVSNTPNLTYQVEFTLDDIFNTSITPTAFTHSQIVGKTSDFSSNQTTPIRAIRLTTTAYTSGTVTLTALQGGVNPIIYTPNPVTHFQSGIPFVIMAGDAGATGLNFTGTNAVFTLSAAVMTNFWNFVRSPSGGYMYLPASAGGLASGGWYFFRMTSDTDGEVFQEMYPGTGEPIIPSSPTQHPNLTPGRITQSTGEIVACSTIIPGGSMGPNGILRVVFSARGNNSAGTKTVRVKSGLAGGTMYPFVVAAVSTAPSVDYEGLRQNAGTETAQLCSSLGSGRMHTSSGSISSGERMTIDTTVDNDLQMTLQVTANTDSVLGILRLATVQYRA